MITVEYWCNNQSWSVRLNAINCTVNIKRVSKVRVHFTPPSGKPYLYEHCAVCLEDLKMVRLSEISSSY